MKYRPPFPRRLAQDDRGRIISETSSILLRSSNKYTFYEVHSIIFI